jgi:hypothetical protein
MIPLEDPPYIRSRTKWLTASFWIVTTVFAYWLGFLGWWKELIYIAAAVALLYLWWKRRRRSRYPVVFGAICGFFAAMFLGASGTALLSPFSIPVDSVGPRRVECGSVVNPVPADELTVTGDYATPSPPIAQSTLEQRCSNRRDFRGRRATDLALVGLALTARATGHLATRPRVT